MKKSIHKKVSIKNYNAIRITKPYGRFGNNYFQILNAIVIAKTHNLKYIFLPNFSEPFISYSKNVKGLRFIFNSKMKYRFRTLEGLFFSSLEYKKNFIYYKFIAKNYLPKLLNLNEVASNDLVIHIRSGDIFTEKPHPDYIQPPLAFYKVCLEKIFQENSVKKVTLVYEDLNNPVISALLLYFENTGINHCLVSSNIKKSVEILMSAQILIGGVGSFIAPTIIMSSRLRRLFISGHDQKLISIAKASRVNTTLGFFKNYIEPGEWVNNEFQRKLMIDLSEKDIILGG